ncbi:hypothetical protein Hanom_Chr10g00933251 [Helianthus anomalus]
MEERRQSKLDFCKVVNDCRLIRGDKWAYLRGDKVCMQMYIQTLALVRRGKGRLTPQTFRLIV